MTSHADGEEERWDSYGRLVQPSTATVPHMTIEVGVHLLDCNFRRMLWQQFNRQDSTGQARWPFTLQLCRSGTAVRVAHALLSPSQGNHELESIDGAPESFLAYESRWRMPFARSGSKSALYYSYETGPAHVIMLGSYAAYGKHSKQVCLFCNGCRTVHLQLPGTSQL